MTVEQRDKYAYELMVKNNPEEAVKQLLLKDKVIEKTQQRINKSTKYIKENKTKYCLGRNEFTCELKYSNELVKASEVEDILKGE